MGADLSQISILARREIEARILISILQAFIQEFGEEKKLKIVSSIIASIAAEAGRQLARLMGDNSLEAFASGYTLWTKKDALKMEILEQGPKKFFFNVNRCRYADMSRELGIQDFGHLLSYRRDAPLITGLNPQIKLTRAQTIINGAPYCDFRYELP